MLDSAHIGTDSLDKARETAPIACTNGTQAQTLIDARLQARNALRSAMEALQETAPHARDYQLDRTGKRYGKARELYALRFNQLTEWYNALGDECEVLQGGQS